MSKLLDLDMLGLEMDSRLIKVALEETETADPCRTVTISLTGETVTIHARMHRILPDQGEVTLEINPSLLNYLLKTSSAMRRFFLFIFLIMGYIVREVYHKPYSNTYSLDYPGILPSNE